MSNGLDLLNGGYEFNNIVTWQTGPVFNVTSNGGRVDLIGDPSPDANDESQGLELHRAAFRGPQTPVYPSTPSGPHIETLGRNVFCRLPEFYCDLRCSRTSRHCNQ
jgi:hypothetical protein